MKLLNLFANENRAITGRIGYFGLEDWWLSIFSNEERDYIQNKFQPLGDSENSLVSGDITYTSQSVIAFLYSLAGWFGKEHERSLAYKILDKAEELVDTETRVLDLHFLYGEKLKIYYKDREKPGFLEQAIEACKQQISVAPKAASAFKTEFQDSSLPGHQGYYQLSIIWEKQKCFQEAVDLCKKASVQRWAGDWQKRIERCNTKKRKQFSGLYVES